MWLALTEPGACRLLGGRVDPDDPDPDGLPAELLPVRGHAASIGIFADSPAGPGLAAVVLDPAATPRPGDRGRCACAPSARRATPSPIGVLAAAAAWVDAGRPAPEDLRLTVVPDGLAPPPGAGATVVDQEHCRVFVPCPSRAERTRLAARATRRQSAVGEQQHHRDLARRPALVGGVPRMEPGDLRPEPLALRVVRDPGDHRASGAVAQGDLDARLGPQVEQPVGVPVVAAAGRDDDDRRAVADGEVSITDRGQTAAPPDRGELEHRHAERLVPEPPGRDPDQRAVHDVQGLHDEVGRHHEDPSPQDTLMQRGPARTAARRERRPGAAGGRRPWPSIRCPARRRPAGPGRRTSGEIGNREAVPHRREPLCGVRRRRGAGTDRLRGAQQRQPPDLGDPPGQVCELVRPGPRPDPDHAHRPRRPRPAGEHLHAGVEHVRRHRNVVARDQLAQPGAPADVRQPPDHPALVRELAGGDAARCGNAQLRHARRPLLARRHRHAGSGDPLLRGGLGRGVHGRRPHGARAGVAASAGLPGVVVELAAQVHEPALRRVEVGQHRPLLGLRGRWRSAGAVPRRRSTAARSRPSLPSPAARRRRCRGPSAASPGASATGPPGSRSPPSTSGAPTARPASGARAARAGRRARRSTPRCRGPPRRAAAPPRPARPPGPARPICW